MWDNLKDILTSANGVPLVVIIVLLVVLVIRMAVKLGKAGLLNINTKYVHLGRNIQNVLKPFVKNIYQKMQTNYTV